MTKEKTTLKCSGCKQVKSLECFYPEPSRGSREYSYHCTVCRSNRNCALYATKNPDANQQGYKGRRGQNNTFDRLQYSKRYRQNNYGQYASYAAKRKAQKINATPPWFETVEVQQLYDEAARLTELTGIPFHVDHIVPLQNDQVCGLHCLANLQILVWVDNLSKNNTFVN